MEYAELLMVPKVKKKEITDSHNLIKDENKKKEKILTRYVLVGDWIMADQMLP